MIKETIEVETKRVWVAPMAAIVSAIGSLACCLPFAFLAALGAAGASAVFAWLRPWLLAFSGIMLIVGFIQVYRGGKSCRRPSVLSVGLLWFAVVVFLFMLFFPQQVSGLLAGG